MNWVAVDNNKLNLTLEDSSLKAINIRLSVSPYDVPVAVRGNYDAAKGCFIIELKYIQDEETVFKKGSPLSFHVGKSSERIYSIEVDLNSVGANAVSLQVIKGLEPQSWPARIKNNLDMTRSVIEEHSADLFAPAGLR